MPRPKESPVQRKQDSAVLRRPQSANAQKLAQYTEQQQTARQQIELAELNLREEIARLQQLRSRYPNSPDLESAISKLQDSLKTIQQSAAQLQQPQTPPTQRPRNPDAVDDAAVTRAADQTKRFTQISQQAQASAAQANSMATATVANLARSSTAPVPPSTPIQPRPQPADRSPASVPPPPPPPSPATQPAGQPSASLPSVAQPTGQPSASPPPAAQPAGVPGEAAEPPLDDEPPPAASIVDTAAPPLQPPPAPAANDSGETEWFNKLNNGLLKYTVPQTMLWKVSSTVTVQILGEKTPNLGPMDNQTGQASIKVARRMKVLVSAPDNPDEFTIVPESDTQLEQYVPEDAPTTWHFSVTPRYTASAQKLVVQAWVIYDTNTQHELPVYQTVVNVHVPGIVECLKRLFEGDPDYWLKYGLPGGAGFVFVSGFFAGLWKWLKKRKTQVPQPAGGS